MLLSMFWGSAHKNNVVHRSVKTDKVDVLYLHEMKVARNEAIGSMKAVLKGWKFVDSDSEDISKGLLIRWNKM